MCCQALPSQLPATYRGTYHCSHGKRERKTTVLKETTAATGTDARAKMQRCQKRTLDSDAQAPLHNKQQCYTFYTDKFFALSQLVVKGKVKVQLHPLLTSALDEVVNFTLRPLYHYWNSNPGLSSPQPSRYTDYATPALFSVGRERKPKNRL
jgi:hypothetical protein